MAKREPLASAVEAADEQGRALAEDNAVVRQPAQEEYV